MVDGDVDLKNLGSLQGFCGQFAGKKRGARVVICTLQERKGKQTEHPMDNHSDINQLAAKRIVKGSPHWPK